MNPTAVIDPPAKDPLAGTALNRKARRALARALPRTDADGRRRSGPEIREFRRFGAIYLREAHGADGRAALDDGPQV